MSHWHPVAHASELAAEGDFVCLPWRADGEIAVTNIAGEIVAFDNRCPHRGARIFTELRGNRPPVCAYHGRCAQASAVRRYKVEQYGEFVCAADGAQTRLIEQVEPAPLGRFVRSALELRLHSTLQIIMECHWTVAVENALDSEHLEHVHTDSLAKLALRSESIGYYGNGSSFETFTSEAGRLGHLSRFFPGEQRFDYAHAHMFPYSCLSSTRGWTYSLQHYFPRADGRTNFIHRLYAAETTKPMPEFFDSVARLNEQVFREDAAICAGIPAWFIGELGPREDRIRHFRKYARPSSGSVGIAQSDSEGGEL